MKNRLMLLGASLCLIVSPLRGNANPPASLPTGYQLLDLLASESPCSVSVMLQYVNATGGLSTYGTSADNLSFDSYASFQSYTGVSAMQLFNMLGGQNSGLPDIRFKVVMTYAGSNALTIDTDLGSASNITASSFYGAPVSEQALLVPMQGVMSASFQVGNGQISPLATAGTGGIFLDASLANNNYERSRVMVTFDDGQTAIYTQYGNAITQPTLQMFWIPAPPQYSYDPDDPDGSEPEDYWLSMDEWDMFEPYYDGWYSFGYPAYDSYNISVTCTYGADTVIESTSDFITWTIIAQAPWNYWVSSMVVPVTLDSPRLFFRARSF